MLGFEPRSVGSPKGPLFPCSHNPAPNRSVCRGHRVRGLHCEPLCGEGTVPSTLVAPPRLIHHPGPAPSIAIKHLFSVNSNPMPGRIQQSPAGGCQREARSREASEQRAEGQEEVPQRYLYSSQKDAEGGKPRRFLAASSPNLHLIWESFAWEVLSVAL